MTINQNFMVESLITSNYYLMVLTGDDPEDSVEEYFNAVAANIIINIVQNL